MAIAWGPTDASRASTLRLAYGQCCPTFAGRATEETMEDQAITAIIPLHNGGEFIEEALNSALTQTLPPAKINVVDDGSTDNGPEIVEQMARHHNISLIRKQNAGQSSARNLGAAH